MRVISLALVFAIFFAIPAPADDWPQWGRDGSRNMVSPDAKNIPTAFDITAGENVKWKADLGDQTYGNPVVAGGRVFVGTNNAQPRDPKRTDDFGVLMAFDEATGKFLWQLLVPKLGAGNHADWSLTGLCSSPTVEGERVYVVTNRCEVVCLDVKGLADGNDGPFTDEAQYTGGAIDEKTSADIVWRFNMYDDLGVFPHNMASSAVLVVGDYVYATTSNSADWTGKHTPNPNAPALICLDKKTGKLIGQEKSGISGRLFNSNWSSPAHGVFDGKELIVFGGGDGFCYGFEPITLKEIWRIDCNPPGRREKRYEGNPEGPSEIIATPVIANGRVYVAAGQAPDNGEGAGALSCIDGKTGKLVWQSTEIDRSMSTVAATPTRVFAADLGGNVHCLDATTGKQIWKFETESPVWGSTLLADGKLFVGTEGGLLVILDANVDEAKLIAEIDFAAPLYSTPIVAKNTLYITTPKQLFAIAADNQIANPD